MARIAIAVEAPAWRAVAGAEPAARRAARAALDRLGLALRRDAEISILLTDDAAIRALNARWRGKDRPTNVLSFPASNPAQIREARALGDIVVACETLLAEAQAETKRPQDHLAHLVVHGLLHLFGYDHESGDEAEKMEALERLILADIGVADPYAFADGASPRGADFPA